MRTLDELDWSGDILAGHSRHVADIRVRIKPGGEHEEDAGREGWARWTRGGVEYWVVLDGDGTLGTHYEEQELEVLE